MNRSLQLVNFVGVVALAVLCVFQWRGNRELNLEVNSLLKHRMEHVKTIENQEKEIKGCRSDLESFRELLARTNVEFKETEKKLHAADASVFQLTNERDQLRSSITNWAAAVSARDDQLKKLDEQLQSLATDRNEAVVRFNELAEKYNGVVKDLNDRTQQLNDLIAKARKE